MRTHLCILTFGFSLLSVIPLFAEESAPKLYQLEINEKNPSGTQWIMSIEEMKRDEKVSLIKQKIISRGSSVGSAMTVVKALYEIAKIRKCEYFINLKEWSADDGGYYMLVGFSTSKDIDIKNYFGQENVGKKDDELKFLSVKDFSQIFEKKTP